MKRRKKKVRCTCTKVKHRSGLECRLHKHFGKEVEYEPFKVDYVVHKSYTPDFVSVGTSDTWYEAKGFFRPGDTIKYKAIRNQFPDKRLVFIFSNPHKPTRKDVKSTHADWAEKNGWEWRTEEDIKRGNY